jgi:hypothetical protein
MDFREAPRLQSGLPRIETMTTKKLDVCSACGGFVPARALVCPHCSISRHGRSLARAIGGAIGGGAIAFTLMACYGVPPCDGTGDCTYGGDGGELDGESRDARPDVHVGSDSGHDASDAGEDAREDAPSDAADAG